MGDKEAEVILVVFNEAFEKGQNFLKSSELREAIMTIYDQDFASNEAILN